jgi:predicted permease
VHGQTVNFSKRYGDWHRNRLRVGGLTAGSMGHGIIWGLVFGVLCTFVPLLLFWFAWRLRKRRRVRWFRFTLLVLGLAAAMPNLLTLTVVFGGGNAAHAGQRIMDVDAAGFRGATLVGAVVGALLFTAVVVLNVVYRRRGREMRDMQTDHLKSEA